MHDTVTHNALVLVFRVMVNRIGIVFIPSRYGVSNEVIQGNRGGWYLFVLRGKYGHSRGDNTGLAGKILDRLWTIHAPAYRQLAPFGKTVGIPFLLLGATLAVAGTGWFLRRLWGWRRAVAIIATQVLEIL